MGADQNPPIEPAPVDGPTPSSEAPPTHPVMPRASDPQPPLPRRRWDRGLFTPATARRPWFRRTALIAVGVVGTLIVAGGIATAAHYRHDRAGGSDGQRQGQFSGDSNRHGPFGGQGQPGRQGQQGQQGQQGRQGQQGQGGQMGPGNQGYGQRGNQGPAPQFGRGQGGPGAFGPQSPLALGLMSGALHGEFVVSGPNGYVTERAQRGEVTATSSTSITVRSTDGYSSTYAIDATTRLLTSPTSGGTATPPATGTQVIVLGTLSGDRATATLIAQSDAGRLGAGLGGPAGPQLPPASPNSPAA